MSDDIVARLRAVLHEDRSVELMNTEAADEIERIRKERDDARRRVCEDAIWNGCVCCRVGSDTVRCETSKEVAEMMGWDCFKEER